MSADYQNCEDAGASHLTVQRDWNHPLIMWQAVWDQLRAHRPQFSERVDSALDCALAEIRRLQAMDTRVDTAEPEDDAPEDDAPKDAEPKDAEPASTDWHREWLALRSAALDLIAAMAADEGDPVRRAVWKVRAFLTGPDAPEQGEDKS